MARAAAGSQGRRPDDRGHLRASAQLPAGVAEEFRAAPEVSAGARSRPLHHEAGCRRAPEKRRAVPAHVDGRSFGRSGSPRRQILSRELDADLARRGNHVCVHVLARGPPSGADFDAGASARLPAARQDSRRLALGEALESSWAYYAPAVKRCKRSLQGLKPVGCQQVMSELKLRPLVASERIK